MAKRMAGGVPAGAPPLALSRAGKPKTWMRCGSGEGRAVSAAQAHDIGNGLSLLAQAEQDRFGDIVGRYELAAVQVGTGRGHHFGVDPAGADRLGDNAVGGAFRAN